MDFFFVYVLFLDGIIDPLNTPDKSLEDRMSLGENDTTSTSAFQSQQECRDLF